jgi:hypothetical protein
MEFSEFKESTSGVDPPDFISDYLKALWYDFKGEWEKSHTIIQDIESKTAAWIHAYLHRKEGDIWNADYWYTCAGRKRPLATLEEEWESIVKQLIDKN